MEPAEFHWPFSVFYSAITPLMEPVYRAVASYVNVPETAESLLDIGGGDGRLAIAFARTHPQLRSIVSADISKDMTRRARRRIDAAGLASRISAEREDMQALSYPDGGFDAAVSFLTLHHARRPDVFLAEAYRVIKPGGKLCIVDGYNRPSLSTIRRRVGAVGGSDAAALLFWFGCKECLTRERIERLMSETDMPWIDASFDGLLVTIGGEKPRV